MSRHRLPSRCLALLPLGALAFLAPVPEAAAEVVSAEIAERSRLPAEGETPEREEISGRLHFAVEPDHERNRIVADLELAPRDGEGRVRFSSDFRLTLPLDEAGSSAAPKALWVEVPNRGGASGERGFLASQGFAILEIGWEFDLPPRRGRFGIEVPVAAESDGTAIRGVVEAIFVLNEASSRHTVNDLEIYPPVDAAGPDSRLLVRERSAFPGGEPIPRQRWRLEGNEIVFEEGFEPGRTYEVAWLAEGPPVGGLGFAAVRDAVAWLKHGPDSPVAVDHAYAFGASQCGRFLRDFVYQGFNTDEAGRAVLDGMIAQVAGAGRLDLNRRWAVPRELALFRAAAAPFADAAVPDPRAGGESVGLLENPRTLHRPRVFHTVASAEYWGAGRAAALIHTDPEGREDLELPEEVRVYAFAGTQHGPAPFPPEPPAAGAPRANPVNFRPTVRALRLAMHRWVAEGAPPPPSAYPQIADGTLVPVSDFLFPELPGLPGAEHLSALTAGPRSADVLRPESSGSGAELPLLVAQVDADGNELAGLRLPEVAVPLGTATGWVFRPPSLGAPDELLPVLRGAFVPFSPDRAAARAAGDPRPSVEERYPSRDAYLDRIREVAETLVEQGYLLPDAVEKEVVAAEKRWDWVLAR